MFESDFDSDAERDMAILATTDLDIEPMFLDDPGPNWLVRGETELELVAACERQIGYLHAMQFRALARFAAHRPSDKGQIVSDFAADEIALAAGWTCAVAGMRLNLAFTLTQRLPATLAALERGEIDLRRVQRLAELTDPLPVEIAREVEAAVLPEAAGQNASELARAIRKAIARLDPAGAEERHQTRKQDRRVELIPLDDAMAELRAYLPAADATRIHRTLDEFARAAATPGDERTMDQRRADAFTDLMLGPPTGRGNGVLVHVTMPATMLMGLDEQAAELAGYGQIPAEIARMLAADATWRRLLTDPATGHLLDCGRTTYRPPAALADFVRARDRHCVFPGCGRTAASCDIDHRRRYPDGPTSACNLECLCRHHLRLKHEAGWSLDKRGDTYLWTTPTGRRFECTPVPVADPVPPPQFEPAADPPPF